MKAVIPVAGVGTKLRPHTHTQPKPLIPVAGKPILGHIIESLLNEGITSQVFIVGYLREKIQDYVQTYYGNKIDAIFVVQEPRRGLAHALWMTREEIEKEEEVLIVLGDTIFMDEVSEIVKHPGTVLGVKEVEDPREYGIAVVNEDGEVLKTVEKPNIPTSNLALVGLYKLSNIDLFLDSLQSVMDQEIPQSLEYQLTDALQGMIDAGASVRAMKVKHWFDCGRKQTLLFTNRVLLDRAKPLPPPEGTYHNTVIIPPVYIAQGCHITDSIIGPNVAIAEHAVIHSAIVQDSILGAYSTLERIILQNSVIGNDTTLRGRATSVNLGDNTEIDFDE